VRASPLVGKKCKRLWRRGPNLARGTGVTNPFDDNTPETAHCAICGVTLRPGRRTPRLLFKAAFYYFCGHDHRVAFKRDPEAAAEASAGAAVPVQTPPRPTPSSRRGPFSILTEEPPEPD